jgi:hypothetical protein
MGFFDKKPSFGAIKNAMKETATKVSGSIQNTDIKGAVSLATEAATSIAGNVSDATKSAYASTKEKIATTYEAVSEEVSEFDYAKLHNMEYYKERYTHYTDIGGKKISEYFCATFEVDKSTMDMVKDVRSRLPVPAHIPPTNSGHHMRWQPHSPEVQIFQHVHHRIFSYVSSGILPKRSMSSSNVGLPAKRKE